MLKICLNCNIEYKTAYRESKFCTRSCSVSYTNKTNPKRLPEGSCKICHKKQSTRIKVCSDCKKTVKPTVNKKSRSNAVISWRRRTKLRALEYKGGKCQNCGYNKSIHALQFHHKDPTLKDFTISSVSKSWEKIQMELDKCILLCANCHAEEHDKLQP